MMMVGGMPRPWWTVPEYSASPAHHVVVHYLYFPARPAADEVAATLSAHGFTTDERRGADGLNWLVLASHTIAPTNAEGASRRGLFAQHRSWAHSAQGDVSPDGVTLGADLSIGGGSEEVSTWTEMVTNGAERPQETLGVLG